MSNPWRDELSYFFNVSAHERISPYENCLPNTYTYGVIELFWSDLLHGRPQCLGKLPLDIHFPDLSLAFEYQGNQYDRLIDSFGGKEGFRQNQRLVARKQKLCEQVGLALVEVRKGYNLDWLEDLIQEFVHNSAGKPLRIDKTCVFIMHSNFAECCSSHTIPAKNSVFG